MSGKVVSWAMEQRTGSPAAKLVLVKLADNANEQGFCWPSVDLMVEHTELGQSTVYKHLTALEEIGLFHSVDHQIGGAVLKAYQLHVPGWEDAIPRRGKGKGAIPPDGKTSPAGGIGSPAGGKTIPPHGIPYKEEPSIEPSIEPSGNQVSLAVMGEAPPSEVELAVQAFNQAAEVCPKWAKSRQLTANRKKVIAARLGEVGLAGWRRAVELAANSGHLGGPVPTTGQYRNWRMDVGWFAKAENFAKIIEGTYAPGSGRPFGLETAARGIAQFLQEGSDR